MFKNFVVILMLTIPFLTGCVAAVATTALVGSDMASDRRTSGIYIEDQAIELKANAAIAENASLKESATVSVTSFNRIVLLVGQAPNQQLSYTA